MAGCDNADSKWSEKKMEGEDSVKTVDCLRGRLLAERLVSKNTNYEAELLGNKLIELENMLKEEAKSRNRAEKKLKLLMNKLKSKNISYVSDGSEQSSLVDKSDISSCSSNCDMKISTTSENQEPNAESPKEPEILQQNDSAFEVNLQELKGQESEMGSENFERNIAENTTFEDSSLSSRCDANSEKSSQIESNQNDSDSKMDEQSDIGYNSVKSSTEVDFSQEDDQDPDKNVDYSMALVVVDMPQKNQKIDPEVLDASVKEVLDALRHAKEQLQSSMERRRTNMIRVG